MTKTKIVATLGPASSSDEMVARLIKAGADIFRLNMSHGDRAWHRSLIRRLKTLPGEHGLDPVGILADLSGPKIRVGRLEGGSAELAGGSLVTIVSREAAGTSRCFQVGYDGLGEGLKKGARVLIDDGMIELRVIKAVRGEVECRVVKGGLLKEHKGVNFPGLPLNLPSMTAKDDEDLRMLLREGVDYIALSFVRGPADVLSLKEKIAKAGRSIPVIAKIERPEAVKNIREIVRVSDGIMVARGDLGVEMAPELVPPIQKRVITLCNEEGKPVITATQMLESMVHSPRPTRAEASDVAGAVFDGTDALMLSEETASGEYPEESIKMMDRIAREAERHLGDCAYRCARMTSVPDAVAHSACAAADSLVAKAIICFTRSGATALLISKHRPETRIIAVTHDERVFRMMRLYYAVTPLMVRLQSDTDGMIREVEQAALGKGLVKKGDRTVVTLGTPVTRKSPTNLMKVHRIGEGFGRGL